MLHLATYDQRLQCDPLKDQQTHLEMASAKVVCCIFSTNIPCRWKIHLEHEWSIDLPLLMYVAVCRILCCFYTVGTY